MESLEDTCIHEIIARDSWHIEAIFLTNEKYVAVDERNKSYHTILVYTLHVSAGLHAENTKSYMRISSVVVGIKWMLILVLMICVRYIVDVEFL